MVVFEARATPEAGPQDSPNPADGDLALTAFTGVAIQWWHSRVGRFRLHGFRNRAFAVGFFMVVAVIVIALLAPLLAPGSPLKQDPNSILLTPRAGHLFGTDEYGRDIYTRVIWGGRVSLLVGISAVALGGIVGIGLAMIAASSGGWVDMVLSRAIEILLSFPTIVVAIMLIAILNAGTTSVIIALAVGIAPKFARVVRGEILSIASRDFITAARASGASALRIMLRHVLVNMVGPIVVLVTLYLPYAILVEASLSFLGLGVSPDTPTWGRVIGDGRSYFQLAWWITVFPGLAISTTVLGFNLLGDGMRDILDPKVDSQ